MIWIILLLATIPVVHVIQSGIIKERLTKVNQVLAPMDAQFQRRLNLIPDLVALLSIPLQSADLLAELTKLRNKSISPFLAEEEKISLDKKLSQVLKETLEAADQVPAITTHSRFRQLHNLFYDIEAQLGQLRSAYNEAAKEFNASFRNFPTNVFVSLMNLKEKVLF